MNSSMQGGEGAGDESKSFPRKESGGRFLLASTILEIVNTASTTSIPKKKSLTP
jgi:hypothetical protein